MTRAPMAALLVGSVFLVVGIGSAGCVGSRSSGQEHPVGDRGRHRARSSAARCHRAHPHLVGRQLRRLHRREPTNGRDRRQAGRVLEPHAGDPAVAVAGDGAVDLRLPGSRPVAGGELPPGQAGPSSGFGVGFLPGELEPRRLHEHTFVESVGKRASVSVRAPHLHDAPREARKLFEALVATVRSAPTTVMSKGMFA